MVRSKRSSIYYVFSFCVLICSLVGPFVSKAQTAAGEKYADRKFLDSSHEISLQQATMAQIVQKLGETAHVSILVDGEPNQNSANFQCTASLRVLLNKLGDTFDYDWTLTKTNVAIFRKKFTVRGERPQAHLGEMQQLMKDVVAAFALAPRIDRGDALTPIVERLVHTFTPEQTEYLQQGKKLSAAALRPDQLSILSSAIQACTFGELEEKIDYYAPLVSAMESSFLVVKLRPSATGTAQLPGTQREYFYVIRDKGGKLVSHYMVQWQITE